MQQENRFLALVQLVLVVAFIGGALLISAGLKRANEQEKSAPPTEQSERIFNVETAVVTSTSVPLTFSATGNTQARTSVNIVPQVSGKVVSLNKNFYAGGIFDKNTTLFKIEQADFLNEVSRLKALIAQSKTNIALQQSAAANAAAEWKTLYPNETPTDLVLQKPQLTEAQAQLNSAKAQLATAKLNLKRTTYSLPYRGQVQTTAIEHGQFVVAGQSYGTVYPLKGVEFVAPLSEQQLKWITDTPPKITVQLGTKNIPVTLNRISNSADTDTRLTNVFLTSKQQLTPGQFGTASFTTGRLQNVYQLPLDSLQKGTKVWQVVDGRLTETPVDIILQNEETVTVRIADTTDMRTIVTQKLHNGIEGARVNQPALDPTKALKPPLTEE